jgi:hypothetical protein
MAETNNISEIAAKISKEIFECFLWKLHPKRDDNFECGNPNHKSDGKTEAKIKSHPADAVFFYEDPYLGKKVYLNTDLKSYGSASISAPALRKAFRSMCLTVECANESEDWRNKYSVDPSEAHEVRGLLFVYNHDSGFEHSFGDIIKTVNLDALPIAAGVILHFLGPTDILRLYDIGNDIKRLRADAELSEDYSFYYPDLILSRRQGDVWNQAAMIESLTGPYLIIKHRETKICPSGYLIYYNRPGDTAEEFEYFLDSLSHYQMIESGERIRIRVTHPKASAELKAIFQMAKKKYVKAWGFDKSREGILDAITIDRLTNVIPTYNAGDIGWRQ